jgi:hypothetical protein
LRQALGKIFDYGITRYSLTIKSGRLNRVLVYPEKDFRASVVVIVGSRQILVREMDMYGNWVSEFQLAK